MPDKASPNTGFAPAPGWQILGALELPAGTVPAGAIDLWLSDVLKPLELPSGILHRMLASLQDAATRALPAESSEQHEHIHLVVFAPSDYDSHTRRDWGFFQIEKLADPAPAAAGADHSIELYVYLES